VIVLFALACGTFGGNTRHPPAGDDTSVHPFDSDHPDDSGDTGVSGPCPPEMALIGGGFCMDRWEATLEEQAFADDDWSPSSPYETVGSRTVRAVSAAGRVPQGYISGDEAEIACAAAGKRLCASTEWVAACREPDGRLYPYGNSYDSTACNDTYGGTHPVVDYFGTSDGVWDDEHMNDPGINQQPGTVAPTGTFSGCASASGVFDLHGNLHEWVDDADGSFRGGFYADAVINGAGCTYVTTAHARSYHDYSTGFRCCSDVNREEP
jgi:sulfatase modifying factor 1